MAGAAEGVWSDSEVYTPNHTNRTIAKLLFSYG